MQVEFGGPVEPIPMVVDQPVGSVRVLSHDAGIRLVLCGEIDCSVADDLRRTIACLLAQCSDHVVTYVVVDLAEVTFADSTLANALVSLYQSATAAYPPVVINASRQVERLLTLIDLPPVTSSA